MVSPPRRLNLDDSTPPVCSHNQPLDSPGRSHYTGAAGDDIGALFNDAYAAVKNMGEGSTKYGSPSTPDTACPVVPEVEEHVEAVKVKSPAPQPGVDRTLDDTLGSTTQKSDGR